jgi:pyridoxine/pyridoxamine 5'-phosphate oxidase
MDTHNLADLYDLPALEWDAVRRVMATGVTQAPDSGGPNRHSSWLTTVDPDGAPHTTGMGALWVDDAYWFQTGPGTRKARNLETNPRCSVAVATHEFDLVVEGRAEPVTDPETVAAMAARQPAPTSPDGPSPPSTARRRPGHRPGPSTGSRR